MTDDIESKVLQEEQLEEVSGGAGKKKKYVIYTVVRGDTLTKIAHHYHTTIELIMGLNANLITNRNLIRTGWRIKVQDNR